MSTGYRDTRSTRPIPVQRTSEPVELGLCLTPGKGVRIPITRTLLGGGQLSHLDEDRRGARRRRGDRARHATRAGRLEIIERDADGSRNPPGWLAALQLALGLACVLVIVWGALAAAGFGWPA